MVEAAAVLPYPKLVPKVLDVIGLNLELGAGAALASFHPAAGGSSSTAVTYPLVRPPPLDQGRRRCVYARLQYQDGGLEVEVL